MKKKIVWEGGGYSNLMVWESEREREKEKQTVYLICCFLGIVLVNTSLLKTLWLTNIINTTTTKTTTTTVSYQFHSTTFSMQSENEYDLSFPHMQ